MLMVMCMKENGEMIKLMGMADICTQMERCMMEYGRRTNNTEKVEKHGLMELNMKEIMLRERRMEEENSCGQMAQLMMASSKIIISMALAFTFGQTRGDMKANG